MGRSELPRITGVAINHPSGVVSIDAPARHGDVIKLIDSRGLDAAYGEQGFITSDGKFIGRCGALMLAKDNGQFKPRPGRQFYGELFSEDLW